MLNWAHMPETREIRTVLKRLKNAFPNPGMLEGGKPEDILLKVTLSARTRDEQVLAVYPRMRKAFPSLKDLAEAKVADIARTLDTIGLYRNKARFMKGIATALIEKHGGTVPDDRESLEALPGVGRKTANCVLCYAFGVPAIAVDTHVHRIANRLGWVKTKDVWPTEKRLNAMIPEDLALDVNRVFVQFGRTICIPRTPRCWKCPVAKWCAYPHKTPKS